MSDHKKELISLKKVMNRINKILANGTIYTRTVRISVENKISYGIELNDTPSPPSMDEKWDNAIDFELDLPSFEDTERISLMLALILSFDGIDFYINNILFNPDELDKDIQKAIEEI